MYRALIAIIMVTALTFSAGCKTREIEADANQAFKADKEAAQKGVQEAKSKMEKYMSPSMRNMQGGQTQ